MFTQFDPPIPMHVSGKGPGLAIGVIDYGPLADLLWVIAYNKGGQIWCEPNSTVSLLANYSLGVERESNG